MSCWRRIISCCAAHGMTPKIAPSFKESLEGSPNVRSPLIPLKNSKAADAQISMKGDRNVKA
jgi:hypothetical protein